ncbi:hypothetical protein YDYSY3_07340 [Paenibacillus chitinolyticus]|uniref:hypothetical protein n=1 Tax=Paenibacillus chitinolyticus TaxID=79263 RepID=UPI0026E4F166|nr:hypothetical protein [Paenibacillus chitinolyticus]GKS09734.1 hypothetical protein YDYSY3_07340 [Paenibacillus chitinolyticus]
MYKFSLDDIESVVSGGKAVMVAEDGIVVAAVQEAIMSGRTATFYLTRTQFTAVNSWYWTPQMIKGTGLDPVSAEEKDRIQSELGIEETRLSYSNRIQCQCGRMYGAFEFMQQGMKEHGREAVQSIFKLKEVTVLRVNPRQEAVCPDCGTILRAPHYYCYWSYGCCRQPM